MVWYQGENEAARVTRQESSIWIIQWNTYGMWVHHGPKGWQVMGLWDMAIELGEEVLHDVESKRYQNHQAINTKEYIGITGEFGNFIKQIINC